VNSLIIRVPDGELTRHLKERYFSYLTIETFVALIAGLGWVAPAFRLGARIIKAGRALSAAPAESNTLSAELRHLVCFREAQIGTCPF
jgi:hypothetical protein